MTPFFVVNPHSANKATRARFVSLLPKLRSIFPDLGYAFTDGPLDAVRLAFNAAKSGSDTVVACGGDGTLNEVVCGLVDAGMPGVRLALMPNGTGGDFCRSLDLAKDKNALFSYLSGGLTRKIDVGMLTFLDHAGQQQRRPFMNVASMGLSGLVMHHVNHSSKALGCRFSFLAGTLRAMLGYSNVRMNVSVDGKEVHCGPTAVVAVANGRFFGGGMMIAPEARLDDGLFDVVIMGNLSRVAIGKLSLAIYAGRHLGHPGIRLYRGQDVRVESDGPVLIELDGEQVGRLPVRAELLPGRIEVLSVPQVGKAD